MPKKPNSRLRQKTPLRRTKGISKESKKRKQERPRYNKRVLVFIAKHPNCEARIKDHCTGRSSQNHHMKRRGTHYLDEETWLAVCAGCHNFIEENGAAARRLGLLDLTRSELATLDNFDLPE